MQLWIGTYPVAGQGAPTGRGEGIWRIELDLDEGRLGAPRQVVDTAAPSFLATGGRGDVLYAVNEAVDGTMTTLRRVGDGLQAAAVTRTGGAHPCHLMFDPVLPAMLVANYTSGSLAVVEVDHDGIPHAAEPSQLIPFAGSGPDQQRQGNAHAHFILPAPGGDAILVADLGSDVIRRFRHEASRRRLVEDGIAAVLEPGSGPRHMVFSADAHHLYVVNELSGRVSTLLWHRREAAGSVLASMPVSSSGPVEPSHVTLDGDRLLIGVRGADVLAEHHLTGSGGIRIVAEHQLPGSWPRHHAVIGPWIVVALQHGDQVAVLDARGGLVDTAAVPAPACVLAA